MAACGADPESPAWRELARVTDTAARADPSVARLWPGCEARGQPVEAARWQQLAQALGELASRDPATRQALTEWLRNYPDPGPTLPGLASTPSGSGPTSPAAEPMAPAPPASAPTTSGPAPEPPAAVPTSPVPDPAPAPPAPAMTANLISGSSVLHGPSVQARDIHGGVHFHPSAATAPPPRHPVPRQLPPVTARFIGREADRQALDALRAERSAHAPQVLVVTGLAGVGKTSFAAHWLHEHADSFPDGQLYADLGAQNTATEDGPVSPATVLEAFLIALGASSVPSGTAQRSALWRSTTSGLRLAVLLDSAFTAAQVRPLLLGTPTGLTMVTSRNNLTGLRLDGASVHRLEGLPAASAVELLAVGGGTRVAREPASAREVVRLCGRLPLAVALASAQLALRPHRSVSALADSLSRGRGAVDTLRVDGEAVMRTALDMSYDVLPGASRALYRRMGLLPADRHDLSLLAALAADVEEPGGEGAGEERPGEKGVDSAEAADIAVGALVESNLLEETGPGIYRFHDLVQPHARRLGEELEDPGRRERTLRRFVDWCLSTAASAEGILTPSHRLAGHDLPAGTTPATPFDGPEEALTWLDTHRNGLMGAVRLSARLGWHSSCWRLTDLMWPLFLRLRPSEMWIEAHRLGLEAARRSGSRQGEGRMLTSGAIGLRDAGRHREAADWYRQALETATADGDVRQQAQALSGLGHVALLAHRLDEARGHFEHALRLRESIGYRRGAALTRRRLGETALAAGDLATAAEQLRRAGTELDALGETYEATRVLALLGHVLDRAGDPDGDPGGGVRRLREALARFRAGEARSEHWEARCLEWLGQAAETRGDREESVRHYEAARALLRRLSPEDALRLDDRLRQR
ncbi:tetratricopeptide repeat protein [Streptomyces sp. NPDC048523]|uniref:tetratricopeptide repeat protein n=1 Tax=Streptomyces sp. NPDC048523 TaxID=3365567 RepID=UPI003723E82B